MLVLLLVPHHRLSNRVKRGANCCNFLINKGRKFSHMYCNEEANKNQLEEIQNDGKNLLDQSLIPNVYFTIGLLSPSSKIRNKI